MIVNIFLKSGRFFSFLCYTFASRKERREDVETWRRENEIKVLYLRHYPALRAPVGGNASFSLSLGRAKASFTSALAPSSILIEGELFFLTHKQINNSTNRHGKQDYYYKEN